MHRKSKPKKKQPKQDQSETLCLYFNTKRGCARGDKCRFIHQTIDQRRDAPRSEHPGLGPDPQTSVASAAEDTGDVDMEDDLADAFAGMKIPTNLTFGRRGGGRSHKMR